MLKLLIFCTIYLGLQWVLAKTFEEECLEKHNEYRKKHSVPPLEIDSEITHTAQEWANHLSSTRKLKHNPNHNYGENIYTRTGTINAHTAVNTWYNEIKNYNWEIPALTQATEHFTQVIWKNTKKLGCAMARNGSTVYVVANYSPPGNFRNRLTQNVFKEK